MDPRLDLLRRFSTSFTPGVVKLETERHGFAFLDELLADGVTLEYGELTASRLLHKYKLGGVGPRRMDEFLQWHLRGECNVCRYFDGAAGDVFCFNIDNNHKVDNTAPIPEVGTAVEALVALLLELGCAPLAIASGRGYHLWCRLSERRPNATLHGFMLRAAVRALMEVHAGGLDHNRLKFNFYPDPRIAGVVSLRLFGTVHAKTGRFSQVLENGRLLDEAPSWVAFARFVENGAVPAGAFDAACARLDADQHGPAPTVP